jgi:hypothetical protein
MEKSVIDMVVNQVQGMIPVTILQAQGELNRFTFEDLINKARELYENGQCRLIVDMSEVGEVSLSGVFALYSVAVLFRGEKPLDPEGGIAALSSMVNYLEHVPHNIRLLKPQPHIKDALSIAGLPIYDDLAGAIASF